MAATQMSLSSTTNKKNVYTYNGILYYTVLRRTELLTHVSTCPDLRATLSKMSTQTDRQTDGEVLTDGRHLV